MQSPRFSRHSQGFRRRFWPVLSLAQGTRLEQLLRDLTDVPDAVLDLAHVLEAILQRCELVRQFELACLDPIHCRGRRIRMLVALHLRIFGLLLFQLRTNQRQAPRELACGLVCRVDDAVLRRQGALAFGLALLVANGGLRLAEDGKEHREQNEDGDEQVGDKEDGVHVAGAVVDDLVDVEVAEERPTQRDYRGHLARELAHHGPERHVEHHREGKQRDPKDDPKED